MPTHAFAPYDPVQLAHELSRARQRGLTDLDLPLHNKPPVPDEELAGLTATARVYCDAIAAGAYGRAAMISRLVWDGLVAYSAEDPHDSEFIKALCFDPARPLRPPPNTPVADNPLQRKLSPDEFLRAVKLKLNLGDTFEEYRLAAFIRFTTFLNGFVLRALAAAPPAPAATPGARRRRSRWWVAGGVALTALVIMALLLALLQHAGRGTPVSRGHGAASPTTTTPASAAPYQPGQTRVETAGEFGVPTFTDPHSPAVTGTHIAPYQQVNVSCKVFAPTIPSVSPDGYWYRIASSPWDGNYYAPANIFLNGDTVGGPTLHNTDFAVPDCPSS